MAKAECVKYGNVFSNCLTIENCSHLGKENILYLKKRKVLPTEASSNL